VRNGLEEGGAEVRILAEARAENAEGTGRIVEALGNFPGRVLVEEESPQGLVLTLAGQFGSAEEVGRLEIR